MLADGTQTLRVAATMMTRDAMQTGRELPNGGIPIPNGDGVPPVRRPGPPGTNLTFPSAWTALPAICPGPALGPVVNTAATDLLTVLYADATLPLSEFPLTSLQADGSRATVAQQTAMADARTGLRPGDLILFSNALGNALQTLTAVEGQTMYFDTGHSADGFGLNSRTAPSGTILQLAADGVFPPTSATRVSMVSYYLDTTTATGQLRLVRREGFQEARVVGLGVDSLQVTYDLVDGTNNPTNQEDAVQPNSPVQIRKVNLFLSRRTDEVSTQTGRAMRSAVTTRVALRSMSFVDRYR